MYICCYSCYRHDKKNYITFYAEVAEQVTFSLKYKDRNVEMYKLHQVKGHKKVHSNKVINDLSDYLHNKCMVYPRKFKGGICCGHLAVTYGAKLSQGATRMTRGGIRLVHGHTKSTLITYLSGMKIDPKYAFLYAFFLICPSCPFQNLSIWPKTHPFSQFCTFLHP